MRGRFGWALLLAMPSTIGAQVPVRPVPPGEPRMVELEARQKAAMVPFAELAGIWRGTTVETRPDGTRERTIAAHRGGPMLDGKTMVLEGRSYREDGSVAFNLMAVISFDPAKGTYEFRAYGRGHVVTIAVHPTPTGYYFERPEPVTGATLRYTVELGGGRWREKGVRMVPGKAAVTVLETDMTRVGTTDWPAGGAVGFRQP